MTRAMTQFCPFFWKIPGVSLWRPTLFEAVLGKDVNHPPIMRPTRLGSTAVGFFSPHPLTARHNKVIFSCCTAMCSFPLVYKPAILSLAHESCGMSH